MKVLYLELMTLVGLFALGNPEAAIMCTIVARANKKMIFRGAFMVVSST